MKLYKYFRKFIYLLSPEQAHNIAIFLLKNKCIPFFYNKEVTENNILSQNIFGLHFKNPVGLSAGFDKNAEAINGLLNSGFSFIEVGTSTPKPQSGNEKPRLFRLEEDKSIINRMGFNNKGSEIFAKNLYKITKKINYKQKKIIVGANIGKNKDSQNDSSDYIYMMNKVYDICDYITINISSPNTKNLRDLQSKDNLDKLLTDILNEKSILSNKYNKTVPLMLKISPDIDINEQKDISEIVLKHKIDALIISNTTISRDNDLKSKYKNETGGLSGKFVFDKSNEVLKNIYKFTDGKIKIIAAGGIFSAEDAYQKIKLGASLVQIYSAIIFEGFSLVDKINHDLALLVAKDGYSNIEQAVGSDVRN